MSSGCLGLLSAGVRRPHGTPPTARRMSLSTSGLSRQLLVWPRLLTSRRPSACSTTVSWKPAMPPVRVTVSGKAAVGVRGGGGGGGGGGAAARARCVAGLAGGAGSARGRPTGREGEHEGARHRIRTAGPTALVSTSATSCSSCAVRLSLGCRRLRRGAPVPPPVRLVALVRARCTRVRRPLRAGLGSAAGFPFHDPSMTRMNSWTFSSTKRATCSRRTACRCWPAPSPRPWPRPARRRRRSAPPAAA